MPRHPELTASSLALSPASALALHKVQIDPAVLAVQISEDRGRWPGGYWPLGGVAA